MDGCHAAPVEAWKKDGLRRAQTDKKHKVTATKEAVFQTYVTARHEAV
jgi:hypothetical protein